MLFKFNNKTGDMEISFSKEEAKIIMKKKIYCKCKYFKRVNR